MTRPRSLTARPSGDVHGSERAMEPGRQQGSAAEVGVHHATSTDPSSEGSARPVPDQYFSSVPSSQDVRRQLSVALRGHECVVQVSNGVFSTSRLDLGTSVLLKHAPEPPAAGTLLDLGCGWGPITLSLGFAAPKARIWAVDVNERALELTTVNARAYGLGNVHTSTPEAIDPTLRFDAIWSNPPIRIGKPALHNLLLNWLPRLAPGGAAYLVVQKNLGADSLIRWLSQALDGDASVAKYGSAKGYRVIEVLRPR